MAAMKAVLADTSELVDCMVKNEGLLSQLRITSWHEFTVNLAEELIEAGWIAPSMNK